MKSKIFFLFSSLVVSSLCFSRDFENFDQFLKAKGEVDKNRVNRYFDVYNFDENDLDRLIENDINLKTKRDYRADVELLNSLLKSRSSLISNFSDKYKGVDFTKASFWLSYNRRICSWVAGKTYFLYPADIRAINPQPEPPGKESTKYFSTEYFDGVIEFGYIDKAVKYRVTYKGVTKEFGSAFFSLGYFSSNSDIAQGRNSSHKVTIDAIDEKGNVIERINVILTVKTGNGYSAAGTGGNPAVNHAPGGGNPSE